MMNTNPYSLMLKNILAKIKEKFKGVRGLFGLLWHQINRINKKG